MEIASASTMLKFHEFPSGKVLHSYQPATKIDGPIRSISWSKDGNWLALVPTSGLTEIISVKEQFKLIHTIHGIEKPSCASFQNTTKRNIAVGTKNGQMLIYDIKTRGVKKRFPRTSSQVTRVEFTAKDEHIMAACESGEAHLYSSVMYNTFSGKFKIPRSQTISAIRSSPLQKNYVVAGSNEGVVAVWDVHRNKNKFVIRSHKAPVTAVAFSPISSNLVVSAGLDRELCFYDIEANKCIGNIVVENNMTSTDFSPDGKFVVTASQNGKIYIYDSKSIQQPVHSFFGHSGPIEHLSFKKCKRYDESIFSISPYDKESVTTDDVQRNNESFDINAVVYTQFPESTASQVSAAQEDPFMIAIGLDQINTTESLKQDSRSSDNNKKFLMHKYTPPSPSKLLQERIHSEREIQPTSTPNFLGCDTSSPISPTITAQPHQEINVDDLKDLVKSILQEELKTVSEGLKNYMKYQSTHILYQTNQMFLDLLMVMVKESIKVENNFNNLRQELISENVQNRSSLLEENLMLKPKIAILEEKLAMLKNNQFNQNF